VHVVRMSVVRVVPLVRVCVRVLRSIKCIHWSSGEDCNYKTLFI